MFKPEDEIDGGALLQRFAWFDHAEGMKFVELFSDQHRSVGHWLLLPGTISAFHRVRNGGETWAIHQGSVLLHVIDSAGRYSITRLNSRAGPGEAAVAVVPADAWQAAEVAQDSRLGFGTNICAPPFAYAHWELADPPRLAREFPAHRTVIERLGRKI